MFLEQSSNEWPAKFFKSVIESEPPSPVLKKYTNSLAFGTYSCYYDPSTYGSGGIMIISGSKQNPWSL